MHLIVCEINHTARLDNSPLRVHFIHFVERVEKNAQLTYNTFLSYRCLHTDITKHGVDTVQTFGGSSDEHIHQTYDRKSTIIEDCKCKVP